MMGRRKSGLSHVNLLALAPRRSAPWAERDGQVVVERPKPTGRGLRRIGQGVQHWLGPARVRLDALGSFTWIRIDGEATVARVCEEVREAFGASAEPVEERVGEFVRLLHREAMLSYPSVEK